MFQQQRKCFHVEMQNSLEIDFVKMCLKKVRFENLFIGVTMFLQNKSFFKVNIALCFINIEGLCLQQASVCM